MNLDRRFIDHDDLASSEGHEHEALVASLLGHAHATYSWSDLLPRRCVVVLGEAQSGKSTEFRLKAQEVAAISFAWCVELDEVAQSGTAVLTANDTFKPWIDGDADAWFFLDAADEAKLSRHSIRTALSTLKQAIGFRAWSRAHFFISCRASDWEEKSDLVAVESMFPSGTAGLPSTDSVTLVEDASSAPAARAGQGAVSTRSVCVVHLLPLDGPRIEALVNARLTAPDAAKFLSALHASEAEVFATRPGDVLWLTARWTQEGRLGRLRDVLEAIVAEKLSERNSHHLSNDTVSLEGLRVGAERLAAATILCRQVVLRRPLADPAIGDGIEVKDVLVDWTTRDAEELLGRAIFDIATMGRVRFHHRVVREYLAACWFKRLLAAGSARREVRSRLYATTDRHVLPIPSRLPVIGWLACMDDELRDYVVEQSPMLLLQHGDASWLPVSVRRRVLRRICEHGSTGRRPNRTDAHALARFATPEIGTDVEDALRGWAGDPPGELIQLAALGGYSTCIPALMDLSCTPSADVVTRVLSIEALRALCDADAVRAYLRRLFCPPALDARVAAAAIENFFPDVMGVGDTVAVLTALSPQPRVVAGPAWLVARHIISVPNRQQRAEFAIRLAELVGGQDDHHWLVGCLAQVSANLLETSSTSEDWSFLGNIFDVLSSDSPDRWLDLDTREFTQALGKCPAAKRYVFWRMVDRLRAAPGSAKITRWYQVAFQEREGVRFAEDDLEWLLEDARCKAGVVDRLLALDIILRVLAPPAQTMARVRDAVKHRPELVARLERALRSMNSVEEHPDARRWAREKTARERRTAEITASNRAYLIEHLDRLRSGQFNLLWWLYQHAVDTDHHSRWAKSSLASIRREFGDEIHDAAYDGFAEHWRTYSPQLPHERPKRNSPENGLLVGLTGLALAYARGMKPSNLSPEEATTAARYACGEINGFPPWFQDLLQAHPGPVLAVISLAVVADYNTPRVEPTPHDVLATLAWAGPGIKSGCAPVVAELLDRPTAHPELLDQALRVLLDCGEEWQDRLRQRARSVLGADTSVETMKIWWPVLFRVDSAGAAETLRQWLATGSDLADIRDACAAMLVSSSVHLDSADCESLATLATIAYEVIRPADDLVHPEVYAPGPRDDAQMARSRIVNALAERPGSSGSLAEIARRPSAEAHAVWLEELALHRLGRDAEPEPMQASAVRELEARFTAPPATPFQLFESVLARLDTIADDALNSMFSTRALFWAHPCKGDRLKRVHEREVQKWLAHELRLRAGGAYSVDREPEEDDMNRPDIRLSRGSVGPVSVELKCADNWSLPELADAVTNQLVGQYMRDASARYGILVLTRADKDDWQTSTRKRVHLPGLVSHLQSVADACVNEKGLGGVRVIAIDFAPPLGSTAARLRAQVE